MSDNIVVPTRIEDAIGFNAWTALSWALHHGWIRDYKHHFSKFEGHDIGVPETVDQMAQFCNTMTATEEFYTFNEEPSLGAAALIWSRNLFMFIERVNPNQSQRFSELLVEGYLCGTDFVSDIPPVGDEHGKNQLDGELIRFLMRSENKPIGAIADIIQVNTLDWVVTKYCEYYRLPEDCKEHMHQKLQQQRILDQH